MNVLILAAGEPPASSSDAFPIWLNEVDNRLILERQVDMLARALEASFIFAFRQADVDRYHLTDIVEQFGPPSRIVQVGRETAGAACTALLAIDAVQADQELLVMSATDQLEIDVVEILNGFRSRGGDAGVLTFESLHPRYSYVRKSDDYHVIEVAEKRPISRSANAGFYWFKRAEAFFLAVQRMVMKDVQIGGRYYLSPCLNEFILQQQTVIALPLQPGQYHPLKTDRHIDILESTVER